MELKWLEDFVELAATRSFSLAASSRHVTQPAFSRRIRALENWVGAELIDRSIYPVKLTAAGEIFLEVGRDLIREMYRVRDDCRRLSGTDQFTLSIGAFHTIALHVLPEILARIADPTGGTVVRVFETDFYGCLESLASGRCDIAFCYSHAFGPPIPEGNQILSKRVKTEKFILACVAERYEELAHRRTWKGSSRIPLISYSPETYLAKLQEHLVHGMEAEGIALAPVYESTFAEGIKPMVLGGAGVGWLPAGVIERETGSGRLLILPGKVSSVDLEVLALRRQSGGGSVVERFWADLPVCGGPGRRHA